MTPREPDPKNTAPWVDGTLAAAALTGTAGGGCNGITAVLRGWGGTESDASCTGFSTELDEATGTTLALELPPPKGKNESIPSE